MMARDLARALDPVLFANDCGITPDTWQADLLRSSSGGRSGRSCCVAGSQARPQ